MVGFVPSAELLLANHHLRYHQAKLAPSHRRCKLFCWKTPLVVRLIHPPVTAGHTAALYNRIILQVEKFQLQTKLCIAGNKLAADLGVLATLGDPLGKPFQHPTLRKILQKRHSDLKGRSPDSIRVAASLTQVPQPVRTACNTRAGQPALVPTQCHHNIFLRLVFAPGNFLADDKVQDGAVAPGIGLLQLLKCSASLRRSLWR